MAVVLTQRLDTLETGLTDRIKTAVTDLINAVKDEFNDKILALEARVASLEDNSRAVPEDKSMNIVIYDMAESEGENVHEKVNNLLSSELKLQNVRVTEAERKAKFEGKDSGVVVAKCKNAEEKQNIMQAKSLLRNSEHHSHIRIYHDKPYWQRQHEANVRLLVKSIGSNKLYLKGNRVCEKDEGQNAWQQRNTRGQGRGRGHSQGRGSARGATRGVTRSWCGSRP